MKLFLIIFSTFFISGSVVLADTSFAPSILFSQEEDESIKNATSSYEPRGYWRLNIEELEKMLEYAIQIEDYDKAAVIRDEITKRRKN